jgi:hypothetical protein
MPDTVVQAPIALLTAPDLPATAKLTWLVRTLCPAPARSGITRIAAAAGLSEPAVRRGIAALSALDWSLNQTVPVPASLLTNHQLGAQARVLYGLLVLTPGFRHPNGHFTYAELAELAHASRNTVARAVADLVEAEWIILDRTNRKDRIHFTLTFPGFARGLDALDQAQRRLEHADPYGQGLMQEFLSLLSSEDRFEDNAPPGFLVNPRSGERLQFDRYYPPNVAFEFNGAQHYRKTKRFSQADVIAQQERDLIKHGICAIREITLVIVHPEDLTLSKMRQKVEGLLPLRDLTGYELLIDYLESESERYRQRIAKI